ncbi:protein phosphatase [Megasphaera cerevisiae DSM 20462]|uniref:Protein phosphatase n=1 Tax=Megasphaera cerevisiae DSM 20462 TaxID=1122219 RepID=A0A0J6X172_9FIRM|nr:Stp1/IreP family PP2C-type Ser/Thr phosphatase [Megasphaera cerevisiae]KMO87912.1 protein phosphatase [Megasphaera cerevisiae DSM 20462]MCI1750076.1 Stp1/IreP family PP2C-type Ser/Thr phosphatase [Megasphaera cerevisiae]OKY53651.1 protein phosphatase [Megasphaera cerevisiae]SJZ43407.1 protein phosphatase [Megasphaera cerevisiae DSM 20462]
MGTYGESKIGLVRKVNEDSFYIGCEKNVLAVADGMGGYVGGEIASKTAVEAIAYYFKNFTFAAPVQLEKAIQYANSCILSKTMIDPSLKGMGTTISIVTLARQYAFWGHVGDSRIYLYRSGELKQISVDHTIVQVLLEKRKITQNEAKEHPQRHVLTRAVGVDENLLVDSGAFQIQPGDRILLCSDGLTSFLDKQELSDAIGAYDRTERDIINDLFTRVYQNGAKDNVTAILTTI